VRSCDFPDEFATVFVLPSANDRVVKAIFIAVLCAVVTCIEPAWAQSTPSPSPSPRPGTIRLALDAHTTFISQGTSGPGIAPPEAAGFANGNPLSPLTPYDVFSSAPLVPGNASESALYLRPVYVGRAFDVGLVLGAGYAAGSVTNAAYWGESLIAPLNPHAGAQALPYRIVFPGHAGQDDGSAFVASVLSGTISSKNGDLALKAGWFDLTQASPFVFVQPAVTNALPAIGVATPETLGDGPPASDAWQQSSPALPLHGVDLVAKHGLATIELTDASLPAPPGTPARMLMGSLAIDHGEGTKYAAQYLHVGTGGDLVGTTVLYGANSRITFGAQGPLPVSTIGGQRQRIYGLSAAFHASKALDTIAELGHSTYDADSVARPGTGKAGNYAHLGVTRNAGRASATIDLYRNDAYYANALLPYGAPENVWSVAWSWPGQWLKSNYQLINDFPVNIDREGYRIKLNIKRGDTPLELRAAYGTSARSSRSRTRTHCRPASSTASSSRSPTPRQRSDASSNTCCSRAGTRAWATSRSTMPRTRCAARSRRATRRTTSATTTRKRC